MFTLGYVPNWCEENFVIKMLKILCLRHIYWEDLNNEEFVRAFYEKELQKANQKELRIEGVIKRKSDTFYAKWKVMKILSTFGLIKKISLYKMSDSPELCTQKKKKLNGELIFSNYPTKSDLKNATGIDISDFAKKLN